MDRSAHSLRGWASGGEQTMPETSDPGSNRPDMILAFRHMANVVEEHAALSPVMPDDPAREAQLDIASEMMKTIKKADRGKCDFSEQEARR